MAANRPLKRWNTNGVDVALWRHADGMSVATCTKQYKDKDGNYQTTTQWSAGDLLILSELAKLAAQEMLSLDMPRR
jgi:hypothetical protein